MGAVNSWRRLELYAHELDRVDHRFMMQFKAEWFRVLKQLECIKIISNKEK